MNITRIISGFLSLIYYIWVKTLRIKIEGFEGESPVIYAFWHSQMFPLIYTHRKRGIKVLVSSHRDGEIVAGILKVFGFRLARGSSTRGGTGGMKSLINTLKKGGSVAITPDGPKGPRWKLKPGLIELSKITGAPIVPVGVGYSRKIEVNSWDRFKIPLPFSNCLIYIHRPERGEDISVEKLENLLTEVNLHAEERLKWR
jgi:hypothetical protein